VIIFTDFELLSCGSQTLTAAFWYEGMSNKVHAADRDGVSLKSRP
jgi:hypothetical protein